ncbi:hypothetical protein FB45DRAFT_1036237 [Roridomyces roridus]|uniref:Uncharacterized protein n=1 Tax=Roridomyces roridus TaxID=1738132 RepID=A0AAD7B901_9AGAR|nr:hypothetical protein FB45DRAFT_1036237 [Roridomyces roridus]
MFRPPARICAKSLFASPPGKQLPIPRFRRVRHDYAFQRNDYTFQRHDSARNHYAYRTESANIPPGWSCKWESWECNPLVSVFQDDLQNDWGIISIIHPLAYEIDGDHFLFHAGGKYYFHLPGAANDEWGVMTTKRFTGWFASHDDFLERFEVELDKGRWVELPPPDYTAKWGIFDI